SYKAYKVTGEYTHLILFPASGFINGVPVKNSGLSYLGFESGKYPIVLSPADPFDGYQAYKEFFFDTVNTGFYWYGGNKD
ncbi:hypothetical protein, partial [Streptococcus pneumoniae]|uniref:hypothetical protein n=1 Tax=Streptococcus pneumoniae TaxID=1313 RepID=UPI0018B0B83B